MIATHKEDASVAGVGTRNFNEFCTINPAGKQYAFLMVYVKKDWGLAIPETLLEDATYANVLEFIENNEPDLSGLAYLLKIDLDEKTTEVVTHEDIYEAIHNENGEEPFDDLCPFWKNALYAMGYDHHNWSNGGYYA
jgi:hypothetical protein